MKPKLVFIVLIIAASMVSGSMITETLGQTTRTCEQCGMVVDADSQAHFKVVDLNGTNHYVECMMCALKLLTKYDQLNITTNCDWYGSNSPVTVNVKQRGIVTTVNPPTALVIAGGGCSKNRIVYNQTAASALLTNNGTSNYLAAIQKFANGVSGALVTVPVNATIMTVAQAALQFGGGTPSPSPSPSSPPSQTCEQCGMNVAADAQAHFKLIDGTGKTRYACCIKCAIKVLTKTDQLNITTNCDWYGPNFPITINVKDNLNSITVNPPTALLIDGSCAKNRVVYDQAAANALLANNGTSRYLITSQNTTIPSNSTVMSLAQAVRTFGVSPSPSPSTSPSPSPSPSPSASPSPTHSPEPTGTPSASSTPTLASTPTPIVTPASTQQPAASASPVSTPTSSPAPTRSPSPAVASTPASVITQQCEACGMDVNAAAQARYKVTDGNGNVHYVECFMCALNLINDYETLRIVTCCDWYGPNYPITVDSSQFGNVVTVNPSTAMFLNGGSCVINRVAYNQTAADALLANGFSQYTLTNLRYPLPADTSVSTVAQAATKYAQISPLENSPPILVLVLIAVVGVLVVVGSFVTYEKMKQK